LGGVYVWAGLAESPEPVLAAIMSAIARTA
jgi:hypothetical protein